MIQNEFGEAGVDNDLPIRNGEERIVEMNNGCICCTFRGDLVGIPRDLADPAPVAQTFFVDDDVSKRYGLDAIVTMVDAAHATAQLDVRHEAQEQVGFADRLLLRKTDVADAATLLDGLRACAASGPDQDTTCSTPWSSQ